MIPRGYPDPTANMAIARVDREQKRRKMREEKERHEQSTEKKGSKERNKNVPAGKSGCAE